MKTPPKVVHALHYGLARCGLPGLPTAWPEGHRWVYIHQRELITCLDCRQALGLPLTDDPVELPKEPVQKSVESEEKYGNK